MNKRTENREQRTDGQSYRPEFKKFLLLFSVLCLLFSTMGCDAFVRKFTRKPKKENMPQEEIVLVPEEYNGSQMTREELYRQYFLFWKSWHDELMEALLQRKSNKKQLDCAKEAIKNLVNLKPLLSEEKQKKLEVYINELKDLQDMIARDIYGTNASSNFQAAERLRRNILRDFSYNKIKNHLA